MKPLQQPLLRDIFNELPREELLSLAFIDLDNFKSVNDHYGHEAGDLTLVTAAERKRASLRTGDMLARWGGEEFILIMPNTYACT